MKESGKMTLEYYSNLNANKNLSAFLCRIPQGKTLDAGMGSGGNVHFLARQGFDAEGVDWNEEAVNIAKKEAKRLGLRASLHCANILDFEIQPGRYSAITCFSVLMFLSTEERKTLFQRVIDGLTPGGIIFLEVMSRKEPGYLELMERGETKNGSRVLENGNEGMHFFTQEEILESFAGFETQLIGEEYFLDTGHGEPHYHSTIGYIGKKL